MNVGTDRPARILIVEDNPGDIRLIREAFQEASVHRTHEFIVAKDGAEALDFLHKRGVFGDAAKPDIITLDLNLPKKNGREVLQDIKSNPLLKGIPVVVFSSSSSPQDIEAAYRNYANCYVTKPSDLDEFFASIAGIERYWLQLARLAGFRGTSVGPR
jgi:chemotaxis family two-component system response regulator Rcp1